MEALESYERTRATPFFKWAGGKTQLLRELDRRLPQRFAAYHEPFLGGGAMFFHLYSRRKIRRAIISDSNLDLINAFIAVRDGLDELLAKLAELQRHAKEKAYFYGVRKRFNLIKLKTGEEGDVEKAALLFYLNKTCYNGLYRVNSKGEFNVPWGGYKNPTLSDEENLRAVNSVLNDSHVKVRCSDFGIVDEAREGDFVYFDPPYQPLSATASFAEYTSRSFAIADQERLAALYHRLSARGCHLMLSNSPKALHLYEGRSYKIEKVKAARAINCVGSKRGVIDELLVTNH